MKAIVDICVGCGLCEYLCPEVYKLEEDQAVSLLEPIPDNLIKSSREAAEDCPVYAIRIEE